VEMAPARRLSPHQRLESYLTIELSSWRRWCLLEGACLALLGLACLWAAAMPFAGSISIDLLLILAGAVALISLMSAAQSTNFALSLSLALIPLATGLYLLAVSREAAANPGWVFAAYFTASGIATILLAAAYRRRLFPQWEWLAVSGVTRLILVLLILSGLPGSFTWMFGVLLGVGFMFEGSARLALALGSDEH
jgi:uncharacterized membrane protein HdeD (DUF308 family)